VAATICWQEAEDERHPSVGVEDGCVDVAHVVDPPGRQLGREPGLAVHELPGEGVGEVPEAAAAHLCGPD